MLNYIITDSTITVLINGIPQIVDNTHPKFSEISQGIKNNIGENALLRLIDTATVIKEESHGKVKVKDGEVFYGDIPVRSTLTKRILTMLEEGFDIDAMCKFMDNLYDNPSNTAVDELYLFLEACNLPITEDGHFLAYKKISGDYKDLYTGTFDNSIGAICEMPRNMVDDRRGNTCSHGLHFASYSYMAHYGGTGNSDRIVIVKINPADVVSIPSDYNNAKGRCWRYEVVNEVNNDGKSEIKDDCIKDEDTYADEYYENQEDSVEETVDEVTEDTTNTDSYDKTTLKSLKDLAVKNLYSKVISIEDISDVLGEQNEDSKHYFLEVIVDEDLNFNQAGNILRDVVQMHELDLDDVYDGIEDLVDSASFASLDESEDEEEYSYKPSTPTDIGIPFGLGADEIKKHRIRQYTDMFGSTTLNLNDYSNTELRKAIESGVSLGGTVQDMTNLINDIVNGVKAESISWTSIESHLPGLDSRTVLYNDYYGLRKYLEKSTKSGEVRELTLRGILA